MDGPRAPRGIVQGLHMGTQGTPSYRSHNIIPVHLLRLTKIGISFLHSTSFSMMMYLNLGRPFFQK